MSTSRVFTVGQVLTAAQMNDLPQGTLAGTSVTANVGPTSGTIELDVITASAVTIAGTGRRLKVSLAAQALSLSVPGDQFKIRLKEGATTLAEFDTDFQVGSPWVHVGPTAASHTYKATIQRISGTGTATVLASGTAPITILVEDIGTF